MQVRILGMNDANSPGRGSMALLVDEDVLLDAGTLSEVLPFEEQVRIDNVVLSHAHFDHIRGLPFLAESNAIAASASRTRQLQVHGRPAVIDVLRKHVFNNHLWPDFTRIPARHPVMRYCEVEREAHIGERRIRFVPLTHPVPTSALHVDDGSGGLLYVCDTGPTLALWKYLDDEATPQPRAMFIDASFPNELEWLALDSGHLTPRMLRLELAKCSRLPDIIYPVHLKSHYIERILDELRVELQDYHWEPVMPGQRIRI